jgi:N-methylhydantoinase A/oxoprolinase/acetone carboxylase beta subunit
MTESRPVCRVGVDIGGTFTDVVALTDAGRSAVVKVASTPDDYGRGVLRGLADALAELDLPTAGVAEIVHGFTVATNAILEGKAEREAMLAEQRAQAEAAAQAEADALAGDAIEDLSDEEAEHVALASMPLDDLAQMMEQGNRGGEDESGQD